MNYKLALLAVSALLGLTAASSAQMVDYEPLLGGSTDHYQWTSFTIPPGVSTGTGGNAGQWAGTTTPTNQGIAANGGSALNTLFYVPLTGSGTAANPSETTDFVGGGIYTFFSATHFEITSSGPLSDLESLTLQLSFAQGLTGAFGGTPTDYFAVPSLKLTLDDDSTVTLPFTFSLLESSGSVYVPAINGNDVVNQWGYQWDLSSVSGSIVGYSIDFQMPYHGVVLGADIVESDAIQTTSVLEAVPEPSTWALLALAGGLIGFRLIGRTRRRITVS